MFELGCKMLLSYLLGSVNGSLTLTAVGGGVDVRTVGSGNAGATNALRARGVGFAFWVMLIDVGKGIVAVSLIARLPGFPPNAFSAHALAAACGIAAVVGHIFPFWFGFRGGKGGATTIGALAALAPIAVIPCVTVWLLALMLTGYVSVGTMSAALTIPVWALLYRPEGLDAALLWFGVAAAVLVVWAHRSNIVSLRRGTEHRMVRAMLLRRGRRVS